MTNSKSTKRALVSSALAVFLCVAMLIGTTFAWFTDTASTSVNKIQAGTLDVALEMYENGEWVNAEGKTLNFKAADGNTNILWEPGCTYELPTLRIVNNGNLALKYEVVITGINGNEKLNEVIEWKYSAMFADGTYTYPADMEGNVLMTGVMYSGDESSLPDYMLASGTFKIIGHMKEAAGNEYQGLSIDGISITVVATQAQYEYDSNGNTYDKDATLPDFWDGKTITQPTLNETDGKYHITSAAEFVAYIKNTNTGNSYVLDRDIDLGGYTIDVSSGSRVCGSNFDGKNHTVSNFTLKGGMYTSLFGYMTINESGRTIENLIVRNATVIGGAQTSVILSAANKNNAAGAATVNNCKVYDSTIIGEKKVAPIVGYTESGTITNCYAENCTVYCADNRSEQAGEVVGYINVSGGHTDNTSNNTSENVTIIKGATYIANGVMKQGTTYLISNANGLEWFADQVNEHNNGFNGYTIKLTADIDLNNAEWYPIGQNEGVIANMQEFFGIFDGDGHTIKNLKIKSHTPDEVRNGYSYSGDDNLVYSVGFFGWLSGAVKNVTFENVKVTGSHFVGVVAGYFQYTDSSCVIENCIVKNCTVTGTHIDGTFCGDKVGGIVGMNGVANGTVKDCKVEKTTVTAGRDAGQVVGCTQNGTSIDNCTATDVTVTAGSGCNGENVKNDIVGRDLR